MDGKKFFYIEKQIQQEKLEEILLLGDKSIITEEKISRIYPQESLFSHIIGQIDDNNNGISGIEKFYDYELKKKNQQIQLTVECRAFLITFSLKFNFYKLESEMKELG